MSKTDTKTRILDAAEQLFSAQGFSATSVRAITSEAGVNLAALNYHFGSKEGLIDAVFSRRLEPLNRERLRILDEAEARADGPPDLASVLEAFLGPPMRLAADPSGGEGFMRLMGRAHVEPRDFFEERLARHFAEVFRRFETAFRAALPDLPIRELMWRMHFSVGVMAHTLAHSVSLIETLHKMQFPGDPDLAVPEESPGENRVEAAIRRMIAFCEAGLKAEWGSKGGQAS